MSVACAAYKRRIERFSVGNALWAAAPSLDPLGSASGADDRPGPPREHGRRPGPPPTTESNQSSPSRISPVIITNGHSPAAACSDWGVDPTVPGCTRVYPGVPGCTPPYPTVPHRTSPYPTVPHATPPYPTLPHPNPTLTHAITHTIAPTLTPTLSPTLTPPLYPHPHPHPPPPHPLPATFYPRTLYLVPSVLF